MMLQLLTIYYRPQRSWGKVMFLQVSVILFTGGVCLSACWDTIPQSRHPPRSRHPQEQTPPRSSACWEIWATSGQYESYWNPFLLTTVSAFGLHVTTSDRIQDYLVGLTHIIHVREQTCSTTKLINMHEAHKTLGNGWPTSRHLPQGLILSMLLSIPTTSYHTLVDSTSLRGLLQ